LHDYTGEQDLFDDEIAKEIILPSCQACICVFLVMQYNYLQILLTNPCFHFHQGSKGKTSKETKKQTSDAPIFWNYCLILEAEMKNECDCCYISFEWKPEIVYVILGW